jgi:VWFA-related protein
MPESRRKQCWGQSRNVMGQRPSSLVMWLLIAAITGTVQEPKGDRSGPQTTIRTGVDLVQLDVSVLDHNRVPVRGLTVADFTILEDAVPQPIAAFTPVDLPDTVLSGASWRREVASDVVSNRFDAQRVIVILLDDRTAPYDPGVSKIAKTIARSVIERLGPADLAAVVYTMNRHKGQEFTKDHSRLLAAVDRFEGLLPPQPGRFSAAAPNRPPSKSASGLQSGAWVPGEFVTEALLKVAEALSGWPGARKSLVFVTPGMALPPGALEDPVLRGQLGMTLTAMQQANLNVYQFDPRGLEVDGHINEDFDVFSAATGGRSIRDTNTPWELVPQVFREDSSYYLLGFRSTNASRDGRFRKIVVKVARPDVEVRTRNGYFAPAPERAVKASARPGPAPLERAISGALPTGDLPMSLTVAPFASPGRKTASLAIVAGVDHSGDGLGSEIIEIEAAAFHDAWKPAGAAQQTVEVTQRVVSDDLHVDIGSRLDLAPGRYEVRVALRSRATSRTGSAYASVTIPDYAKAPLTLSGVVLHRGALRAPADALAGVVPVVPTTVREFSTAERVTAFLRIYQGGRQPVSPAQLITRILDDEDRAVFEETTAFGLAQFGTRHSAEHQLLLPLSGLKPGAYVLSFEATSSKRSAERRAIRFQVR